MGFDCKEIRTIRQRLGWSQAEMARQMGCTADLIQKWEAGTMSPDFDAVNQLRYLENHIEQNSERTAQKPLVEVEMESRRVEQLTHRDLLKDIQ
jgi:transcriptional regulator with XRE-family HTH domain